MKLLILGGNKFIGRELVAQAIEKNYDVTVLSIDPPHNLEKCHWIQVNRNDQPEMESALKDKEFDCVIDNIAIKAGQVENLLKILKNKIKRFVLISSVDIYCHQTLDYAHEDHDQNLDTEHIDLPYVYAKRHLEKELRQDCSNIEKVILRPNRVFGAFDNVSKNEFPRSLFWACKILDNQPILLDHNDVEIFNIVFVKDLVKAILLVVEHPNAANQTFNVSGDNIYTTQSFLENMISALQSKSQIVRTNYKDLYQDQDLKKILFSPWGAKSGTTHKFYLFDNTKLKTLGWKPSFDQEMFHSLLENREKIYQLQNQFSELRSKEINIAKGLIKDQNLIEGFFQGDLSPIAIGTFKGESNEQIDEKYAESITSAVKLKINVVDTAINYRNQHSEKVIGNLLKENKLKREDIFIITKGGYIPSSSDYTYLTQSEKINHHCIRSPYINWSFNQSRQNLNISTIDLYLLHNPERALKYIDRSEFKKSLIETFAFLENEIENKKLKGYGIATWQGLIGKRKEKYFLDLNEILDCAQIAVGKSKTHNFTAIEIPLNIEIHMAFTRANQYHNDNLTTILNLAKELGIKVFTSNSIHYGDDSEKFNSILNFQSPLNTPQKSLLFAKSLPQVTSAIVGMKKITHVKQAAEVLKYQNLDPIILDSITKICKFKTLE